jgi:L-iditol 2-dehydrogenase
MMDDPAIGIGSAWGGFAEYGLVGDVAALQRDRPSEKPHWSWEKQQVIPDSIEPGEATAIITLKETLSMIKPCCPAGTPSLAVIGTGPVARSYVYWASFLRIPVIAVFGRRERWREEMLQLGATHYIVAGERAPLAAAREQGIGPFARAIEAVGSLAALETALGVVDNEGIVAPYGILPPAAQWPDHLRQAREIGRIRPYPVDESVTHDEVLGLIATGRVRLSEWISHRLPLERIVEGLRMVENKEAMKVVIDLVNS